MPNIWNISGNQNISNKKLSSKLTFNVGEKFTGKIIKKEGKDAVVIKLSDGWQFSAELDEEVDLSEKNKFRFEVKDFEKGKLKLKIVKDVTIENSSGKDKHIHKIIKEEGLQLRDLPLLKEMIKRNIPLTRENIMKFKEILFFNKELKNNSLGIEKFIEKYLDSKEIEKLSYSGGETKELLRGFLKTFSNMTREEVLFLLENDVELNKENIDSFNKLFKGEEKVYKFLGEVEENIKEASLSKDELKAKDILKEIEKIQKENGSIVNKEISKNPSNGYIEKESGKVMSLLKSIVGGNEEEMSNILKEVIIKNSSELESEKVHEALENIEGVTINKLKGFLESVAREGHVLNKETLKEIEEVANDVGQFLKHEEEEGLENLKGLEGKEGIERDLKPFSKENLNIVLSKLSKFQIKLSDEEYKKIVEIFNKVEKEVVEVEEKQGVKVKLDDNFIKELLSKKDVISGEIKERVKDLKNISNLLNKENQDDILNNEKILKFVKNNVSDFKLLNAISNEYYYLDMKIALEKAKYPCKLIIKDNRKDSKKIDKNNVKVIVSINTVNLETVDGYISMKNGNVSVKLECEKPFVEVLSIGIENLKKTLGSIGFNINVSVEAKEKSFDISNCRSFFEDKENRTIDKMV